METLNLPFDAPAFVLAPDVDVRLAKLEKRYKAALSGAVVAKARYLSLHNEPGVTARAADAARLQWQRLESIRQRLVARMADVQKLPTLDFGSR